MDTVVEYDGEISDPNASMIIYGTTIMKAKACTT